MKARDAGALVLRIGLGATLFVSGAQKLFGAFGGPGLAQYVALLGSIGAPMWLGVTLAVVEAAGGVAIALGIITRIAAILVLVIMVAALFVLRTPPGLAPALAFGPATHFLLITACLALALIGPGAIALVDRE